MTPVKAKLREARDLVARLKVAHDPIARIELSRALKAAAEDLRDAIVAPSKQSKDVAPEANQAIVEEADGGSTMSTCELVYFVDHGDEYRRSPLFVSMSGDPEVLANTRRSSQFTLYGARGSRNPAFDKLGQVIGLGGIERESGEESVPDLSVVYEVAVVDGQPTLRPVAVHMIPIRHAQTSRPPQSEPSTGEQRDPQTSTEASHTRPI